METPFIPTCKIITKLYRTIDKNMRLFQKTCKLLYTVEDIEFYTPQLLNLFISYPEKDLKFSLELFFLTKCVEDVHYAIRFSWIINAELANLSKQYKQDVRIEKMKKLQERVYHTIIHGELPFISVIELTNNQFNLPNDDNPFQSALIQQARTNYYNNEMLIINFLTDLSLRLKSYKGNSRNQRLRLELDNMNNTLPRGIYIPLFSKECCRIVRFVTQECRAFSTRERVPYLCVVEVLVESNDSCMSSSFIDSNIEQCEDTDDEIEILEEDYVIINEDKIDEFNQKQLLNVVFGESWKRKEERLRSSSPFGRLKNWALRSFIVKAGDNIKQEVLAFQLITLFHKIFEMEELPLYLRPYKAILTSENCGLIETVRDAVSIHTLKQRFPNFTTLKNYFISVYGDEKSEKFRQAQCNFVESMAGYSIVCYLLQIKDRHNENILLDREGHVIHVDFGFMLGSSPGNFGFETAPFKLTSEFIEVMGGIGSNMWNYFKFLVYAGFCALRKYVPHLVNFVEISLEKSKLHILPEFKKRFRNDLPALEFAKYVRSLIDESIDHWRTSTYDTYQKMFNGIIP